ncbi:Uncharacterised protein [uncultured archaeon]|nr:Uncharacterised protein [uncultured archaeon]
MMITTQPDACGILLKQGDWVSFVYGKSLKFGKVEYFNERSIEVSLRKKFLRVYPDQVLRITEEQMMVKHMME